jgi:histone H3/H4
MLTISVLEFIHLISSEANEICEQENKKTIAPEHIISALTVREAIYLSQNENDTEQT